MSSLAGQALCDQVGPTCRGRGWPLALVKGAPRLVCCCAVIQVPPAAADTAHTAQRLRGQMVKDVVQASCREAACNAISILGVAAL